MANKCSVYFHLCYIIEQERNERELGGKLYKYYFSYIVFFLKRFTLKEAVESAIVC